MSHSTLPLTDPAASNRVAVSVVIPLYNRREYIRRAVDSVLSQTYVNFELVVVDDGSTDRSGDIVREYQDPRVRLIAQSNGGECAARNRGVAEAHADWVAFLDSDDEWCPGFLERVMAVAEANPDVIAVFSNLRYTVYEPHDTVYISRSHPGGVLEDYYTFYAENGGKGMTSSSVVVRRQALLEAGGFPAGVRHGGDVDTWTRLACVGDVAYVPETLASYHTEASERVMKDGPRHIIDAPLVTIATCERLRSEGRIPAKLLAGNERMIQCMCLRYITFLTDAGDKMDARRFLREHCRPRLCGRARYWKAYLRTFAPQSLLNIKRLFVKILWMISRKGR